MGQSAEQVRADIERTREDLGQDLDAIGDKISPRQAVRRRTDRVRSKLTIMRERVMGSAESATSIVSSEGSSVAGSVRDAASDVASSVGDAASGAADAVRHAPEVVKEQTEGNPIAVGLIAFGLGALAGTILPSTQTEKRMAPQLRERVVEPVKETASEAAREVGQDLRGSAEEAAERVKQTAQEGAQRLREETRHRMEDVRSEAQEGARELGSEG
jgi:phage-related protein